MAKPTLVFAMQGSISAEQEHEMRQRLAEVLPHHELVIVGHCNGVTVVDGDPVMEEAPDHDWLEEPANAS